VVSTGLLCAIAEELTPTDVATSAARVKLARNAFMVFSSLK
jgi:hypothetical protein